MVEEGAVGWVDDASDDDPDVFIDRIELGAAIVVVVVVVVVLAAAPKLNVDLEG